MRDSLAIPVLSYALWVAFTGSGSSLNELGAQSPQFGGGKPRAGSPSGEPRLASAISMTLMSGVCFSQGLPNRLAGSLCTAGCHHPARKTIWHHRSRR